MFCHGVTCLRKVVARLLIDQPVVVTVTITHDWNKNCTSKVLKITVPVKRADTEYKMPSVGFLKNNEGKNDKTLGLN